MTNNNTNNVVVTFTSLASAPLSQATLSALEVAKLIVQLAKGNK